MREKYNLVDTPEKLKELDKILMDGNKARYPILAFDTETNGLRLHKATVVGFSISFDDQTGYYIPFLKWKRNPNSLKKGKSVKKVLYDVYLEGSLVCNWTGEEFPEFVTPKEYDLPNRFPLICQLLKRWLSGSKLIMHNAPFDVNMTYITTGVDIKDNISLDTALLLHVLDENAPGNLKKAAERYKSQLGINPHANAAQEKLELGKDIIESGGTKTGEVWRATIGPQSKYACFKSKSAKVSMSDGSSKYIEDVKVGDSVITHKGRSRKVYAVNKRNFSGTIYNFKVEGGRGIKNVTGEHPFLTLNQKTLKEEWVKAKDLKPNQLLVKPEIVDDYTHTNKVEDNDFWWFFGLYQADGYVRVQKNNKYPTITQHEDEVHHLRSYLRGKGIKYSEIRKKRPDGTYSKGIDIVICDTSLGEKLIELSGGKFKCWDKKISENTFRFLAQDRQAALHFIAGVYDGDAHFRKMKNRKGAFQLDLNITSQSLINTIDLLFSKHGINCYRGSQKASEGRRHRYNLLLTKNACSELNLYLKTKKREDLQFKQSEFSRYVKVISKDEHLEENSYVFNISVIEDETYITNGLITHNCADTFLTFGIFKAAFAEFKTKFGDRGLDWFFKKEVMPVCQEVVIEMKRKGVYLDVPYFQRIHTEIKSKMDSLEDEIIQFLEDNKFLDGFKVGKGIDVEVSEGAVFKEIMRLEGLSMPTKTVKGEIKETLAKSAVEKAYQENPHWLWGYKLGEDEMKYSDSQIKAIRQRLYLGKKNLGKVEELKPVKRYLFNINSKNDLTWLFCTKLGLDPKKLPQTDSATKEKVIPQMTADVLKEHMLPEFPWVSKILSYKKLVKMESTYIRPVLILNIDGWMYMDMKQNGTTSGRFSCSGGYNLQTLPRVDDEFEILESCEKCHSEDIKIIQDIECMADMKCRSCGHEKTDISRPSAIKRGFIAPPGYKIVNADYSSLEPRCFAFMSNEQALKDVYLQGLDLYSQVYCQIFDTKNEYSADPKAPNFLKKVAKAKRTFIKPIVLGIPYGAEEGQVANLIGATKKVTDRKTGEVKVVTDYEEGKRVMDLYLSKLKFLKRYMDDMDTQGVTRGYVETLIGRRRHLQYAKNIQDVLTEYGFDYTDLKDARRSQLNSPEPTFKCSKTGIKKTLPREALESIVERCNIKRQNLIEKGYWGYIRGLLKNDLNNCKNNPIQGLAASITNKGMLDTNRLFKEKNLDAWVCLQIHDEIMTYAKIEDAEEAAECLRIGMEDNEFAKLVDIPMVADPEICDSLEHAK